MTGIEDATNAMYHKADTNGKMVAFYFPKKIIYAGEEPLFQDGTNVASDKCFLEVKVVKESCKNA